MVYSLIKLIIELGISMMLGTLLFICINKIFKISRDGTIAVSLMLFIECLACGIIVFAILMFGELMLKSNNPNTEYSHIELAQVYIKEKNYTKAIEELNSELKENPKSVEGTSLRNIVQNYISAKKLYDEGKYSESKNTLSNIDKNYVKYKYIKDDVDYLTASINEYYTMKAEYIKLKDDIVTLIAGKRYIEAMELITKVEAFKLNEEEIKYVSQLKNKIQEEQSNQSKISSSTSDAKSTNTSQNNNKSSAKNTTKSKGVEKGKYYVPKFNKYANSEDGLFELYNNPSNDYAPFDYIDIETGNEYFFNPASVKADDYYDDIKD